MKLRTLILSAGFAFGVAACGSEPTTSTETNEPPAPTETTAAPVPAAVVEISDLYIVKPSAGRSMTGGGMKVTATGGDFRLLGASSESADRVELHTMSMEDDMMRMRQVDSFDIAAGETFSLEPGGPHLMLFGLDEALQIGDETEMFFTFEGANGESVTLNYRAEVRSLTDQ